MAPSDMEITLAIRCIDLPGDTYEERSGLRVGVQRGRQEVVQDRPAGPAGDEHTFLVPVQIRGDVEAGAIDYGGPFVQGGRGERFVYICWGMRRDEHWDGVRRAKLPLAEIGRSGRVRRALNEGIPVTAVVQATDARGLPACATLKEDALRWE